MVGSYAQPQTWKSAEVFELNIQLFPNEKKIESSVDC